MEGASGSYYDQRPMAPPKSPARHYAAESISMGNLAHTSDGRQASFETRMAMQRELDAARAQLRSAERESDDLRRQVTQAREESSVHRAESGRREDELRSCRERLNAALDSQQELLAKNTQKHELLLELQNQVSLLREDNAGKTSSVTILEDQVADLDAELRELRARTESGELRIESQLRAALSDLDVARSRITELSDENSLLRTDVDAARRILRDRDIDFVGSGVERTRLRDDAMQLQDRLSSFMAEVESLRHKTREQTAQLEAFRENEKALHERLAVKDNLITELQQGKTRAEVELNEIRSRSSAKVGSLEAELEANRSKERLLSDDLKSLHRFIGRREYVPYYYYTYPRVAIGPTRHTTVVRPGSTTTTYRTYTFDSSSTGVRAPLGCASSSRYETLREERDEAERLADITRARLRRSVREEL